MAPATSRLSRPRVVAKRIRESEDSSEGTAAVMLDVCGRCNRRVAPTERADKLAKTCPSCRRVFHRNCYLSEIGLDNETRATILDKPITTEPCVVCKSGICDVDWFTSGQGRDVSLPGLPRGWLRYRNRFDDQAWGLASQLLKDGFVAVPLPGGAFNVLSTLKKDIEKHFVDLMHSYERQMSFAEMQGKSVVSLETGYANFRMRCPGRFEILAPFIESALKPIIATSLVPQIMQLALHSDDPKQMSCGCFLAEAGAEGQNLHTDGPLLSTSVTLFPYAINCFVPLVPLSAQNGTEFYPGTQRIAGGEGEDAAKEERKKVAPSVPLGYALLFDYRVLHRGLPNKRGENRPCVYVTYSQPWYQDTYNFGSKRYGATLEVSEAFVESREARRERRNQ